MENIFAEVEKEFLLNSFFQGGLVNQCFSFFLNQDVFYYVSCVSSVLPHLQSPQNTCTIDLFTLMNTSPVMGPQKSIYPNYTFPLNFSYFQDFLSV